MPRQQKATVFLIVALAVLMGKMNAQSPAQPTASQISPASGLSLDEILDRMEQVQWSNPARFRSYMLTREYTFFQGADHATPKSQVVAQVSFDPPNHKTFDILETKGSGRGESVVKHMLEHEAQVSKDVATAEFTRRNYNFALVGEDTLDGRRCYVLSLDPKRADRSLFIGKAYVNAQDFHVVRVAGQPAKNPSWWLKSSFLTLDFGDVEGLWLTVATHGSVEVRIFGHFLLDSHKIGQQVSGVIAQSNAGQTNAAAVATQTITPSSAQSVARSGQHQRSERHSHAAAGLGTGVILEPPQR